VHCIISNPVARTYQYDRQVDCNKTNNENEQLYDVILMLTVSTEKNGNNLGAHHMMLRYETRKRKKS